MSDFPAIIAVSRVRGDNMGIALKLVHPDTGAAFNPTGYVLMLTVKRAAGDADSAAKIQKLSTVGGFAITSAATGDVSVSFVPADTATLAPGIAYVADVRAQDGATGARLTVWRGTMTFDFDVSRNATLSIPTVVVNPDAAYLSAQQIEANRAASEVAATTATTKAAESSASASAALGSQNAAALSAAAADASATAANASQLAAATSEASALTQANAASASATLAQGYRDTAGTYATNAQTYATQAGDYATSALGYRDAAQTHASAAAASAAAAAGYVVPSQTGNAGKVLRTDGAAVAWADRDAVLNVAASGLLARTAANTYTPRTITGTAGQIAVTNGDGVAGNPTISLPGTITQATTFSALLTVGSEIRASAPFNLTKGPADPMMSFDSNGRPTFQNGPTFNSAAGAYPITFNGNTTVSSGYRLTVAGTTASTSTTTGSATFGGGIGVAGAGYFGGNIIANSGDLTVRSSGELRYGSTLGSGFVTVGDAGTWTLRNNSGDAYIAANNTSLALLRSTSIASTTEATTGGAGSLTTAGGIYAAKSLIVASGTITHVGQNAYSMALSTTGDRAFKWEGSSSGNDYTTSFTNAGAGKHNLVASGTLAIQSTTASTSTTTGSATFGGGIGVAGAGYFGGNIIANSGDLTVRSSGELRYGSTLGSGFVTVGDAGTWTLRNNSGDAYIAANNTSLALLRSTSIASTTDATTGGAGSLTVAGGIYAAKKIITASTLTTALASAWDFGAASATTLTALDRSLRVKINGVDYYIPAKLTNN